jgi:hypothetical protein
MHSINVATPIDSFVLWKSCHTLFLVGDSLYSRSGMYVIYRYYYILVELCKRELHGRQANIYQLGQTSCQNLAAKPHLRFGITVQGP